MNFGYIPTLKRPINALTKLFGWMFTTRRMQVPLICKMLDLKKKDIFLDVGCGGGNFAYEMSKICMSVGIDINQHIENMIFAQRHRANIYFMRADGLELPFKDRSCDKILLGGTLQAVKQDAKLIEECHRILKKDGILVLSVVKERKAIRLMYESNNVLLKKLLIKLFRLPPTYTEFRMQYVRWVRMTKFYSVTALKILLQRRGFNVIGFEFSPKDIGSRILDLLLIVSHGLKLPRPNHPIYFPVLYPMIYIANKLSKRTSQGNEFVMKAEVDMPC